MKKEEWEILDIFENLATAELIKSILESEGIEVLLRGSTVPYGDAVIFGDGGITEILVKKEQLETAKRILNELRESGKNVENFVDEGGDNKDEG